MGVISEIVAADPSESEAVLASESPSQRWDGFAYKGLDNIKLISLWSLVESATPDDRLDSWIFIEAGPGSCAGTAHENVFRAVCRKLAGDRADLRPDAVGGLFDAR